MIERVAVVGAGTMGHGIAQVSAVAGLQVAVWDEVDGAVEKGLTAIRSNLEKGISRGKVTAEERDEALSRLRGADSLADSASDAELVVEAIPEQMELKQRLFTDLGQITRNECILATNTSSLSVTKIAAASRRPEKVVGLHFFNPVHLMRLLEIVRGASTSDATIEESLGFARVIGKEPIVVTDTPGFASSRLGLTLGLEAMRMVEQGVAKPEDIDMAMVLGYNHPIGPLRLTDLVGLDVRLEIATYLHSTLGGEQFAPPEILHRMVAEGKLGKKSGQGFYEWGE